MLSDSYSLINYEWSVVNAWLFLISATFHHLSPIYTLPLYTGCVQGGESVHVQWCPPGADGLSPQRCRQLPGGRCQVQTTTTDQVVHTKGECTLTHACTKCSMLLLDPAVTVCMSSFTCTYMFMYVGSEHFSCRGWRSQFFNRAPFKF